MPSDLVSEIRTRTGARGFSAFVSAAARRQIEREKLGELLDEMEAANGPVPADLLAEVDKLWPKGGESRV